MGAGHLNVRRAVQQFRSGEIQNDNPSTRTPVIGSDNGTLFADRVALHENILLNEKLLGGSFFSRDTHFEIER